MLAFRKILVSAVFFSVSQALAGAITGDGMLWCTTAAVANPVWDEHPRLTFGRKVNELLEGRRQTLLVTKETGMTLVQVGRLIRGVQRPEDDDARKLASALGCDENILLQAARTSRRLWGTERSFSSEENQALTLEVHLLVDLTFAGRNLTDPELLANNISARVNGTLAFAQIENWNKLDENNREALMLLLADRVADPREDPKIRLASLGILTLYPQFLDSRRYLQQVVFACRADAHSEMREMAQNYIPANK